MKAVILDASTLGEGINLSPLLTPLSSYEIYRHSQPEDVLERARDADIIIVNKVPLSADLLRELPRLKLIAVTATGVNNINTKACEKLGIHVANVQAYARPALVQHTFGLLFALAGNLFAYHKDVQAGTWQQSDTFCLMHHPIRELHGKRMGVIGYGDLGEGVALAAQAFGMAVWVAERPGGENTPAGPFPRVPMAQLLSESDVVSLHCLLSEHTHHLINEQALQHMQSDALLINTARGGLIDEQALADALIQGEIGGAALDVLSTEPPVPDNPLLRPDIPNLLITPHCAWASREARQRLIDKTGENIRAFIEQ